MIKATNVTQCKACGSKALTWLTQNTVQNGIQQNRLNTRDVICQFVLGCNYCSETLAIVSADKIADLMNASTELSAPVAVALPERSAKDYAIEHAEYMAKSADDVMAKFQAYGLALLAVDEGGDDGEGELFEAIDTARDDLQESLVDLRSMVYEFRKRCPRPGL